MGFVVFVVFAVVVLFVCLFAFFGSSYRAAIISIILLSVSYLLFVVVQVGRTMSKDLIFPGRSQMLPTWIMESTTKVRLNNANINGTLIFNLLLS